MSSIRRRAVLGRFGTGPDGAAADPCRRTARVHDGTSRFDVSLSPAPGGPAPPTAAPNAVRCRATYVPLAGHRPKRWAVRFMRDNREIHVWMAPADGVYLPARISVATSLGVASAEATRWATSSK